jgi:hypothetical protein
VESGEKAETGKEDLAQGGEEDKRGKEKSGVTPRWGLAYFIYKELIMAQKIDGYGPEQAERDIERLDGVIDGMIQHMRVFDQKKVSAEDTKKVEGYKNAACMVVRGIAVRLDCLVAEGKTTAQRRALERIKEMPKRKTA